MDALERFRIIDDAEIVSVSTGLPDRERTCGIDREVMRVTRSRTTVRQPISVTQKKGMQTIDRNERAIITDARKARAVDCI